MLACAKFFNAYMQNDIFDHTKDRVKLVQAIQKIKDGFQKGDLSKKFRGSAIEGVFLALAHAGLTEFIFDHGADFAMSAGVGFAFIMLDSIQHLRNAASDGKFGYINKLSDIFKNVAKNTLHFAAVAAPLYISEALAKDGFHDLFGEKPAVTAAILATLIGLKTWVDHNKASKIVKAEQEHKPPTDRPRL